MGEFVSLGPRYFCSKPAGAILVEGLRVASCKRLLFVRKLRKRGPAENIVDGLDDGVMVAFRV